MSQELEVTLRIDYYCDCVTQGDFKAKLDTYGWKLRAFDVDSWSSLEWSSSDSGSFKNPHKVSPLSLENLSTPSPLTRYQSSSCYGAIQAIQAIEAIQNQHVDSPFLPRPSR
ncbi:uncharacterized protein N7473_012555 [Penicillium subrubescens]|uniref:Uncharacterized protein n=1 Tax=Penicillium subrubescens TaxID=1316194 RepID=A0A1Q5U4V2_9EURO|nr:uncharacterized protein N7473_012555 [Penicillium subrubescens]KAJ5875208.1 hypothetical protein N7473_012555 [Penicillium subrubescens]OKP07499.1 hypothetical protein PENSUB_6088 [Penicillium subrubescens]